MEPNTDVDMSNDVLTDTTKGSVLLTLDGNVNEDLDKTLDSEGTIGDAEEDNPYVDTLNITPISETGTQLADEISINVSMTELEMLNDLADFKTPEPEMINVDDEEDDEDNDDRVTSLTNSLTSLDNTQTKVTLFEQISKLHCRLCGELFTDPKILSCLHSFCVSCLETRMKKEHKYIYCPICKDRTNVNNQDVSSLKTNSVIVKLLESEATEETRQNCVVCKMHNEETPGTHVCKDCCDKLCKDCAEKHTFSSLTAKHNVTELVNMDESEMRLQAENKFGFCEKHGDEKCQYMCNDCNVAACRDCVMLSHKNHSCVSQLELFTEISENFDKQLELLESNIGEAHDNLEDSHREDLDFLQEKEKVQIEILQKVAVDMIEVINKKVSKSLEELHVEYEKKRNFCNTRRNYIEASREKVTDTVEWVNFMLKEGTASDILPLQEMVNWKLKDLEKRLDGTFPRVKDLKRLPEVKMCPDNIEVMKRLSFVSINTYKPQGLEKPTKETKKQGSEKLETQNHHQDKETKTKKKSGEKSNITGRKDLAFIPSLLSCGRGNILPRASLLGEYPGHSHHGNQQFNQLHNSLDRPAPMAFMGQMHDYRLETPTIKGFNELSMRSMNHMPFGKGNGYVLLKFQSAINTKHRMDKVEGRTTGLTFLDNMRFVLSDGRNNSLKMFSMMGVALDMVYDLAPMSVTSCNGTLIWNADNNKVKMFNGRTNSIEVIKQFRKTHIVHPVTSFRQEKYLVLNKEDNKVEAYNMANQLVHRIKVKDKTNKPLKDIANIAAREIDQVVLINPELKILFVTDFDGNWKGEYSERRWQPGCAAIDSSNNIFVTDMSNSRLLLLDPKAKFIRQWKLQIKNPYCVACNAQGNLLISGEGNEVYHFAYRY